MSSLGFDVLLSDGTLAASATELAQAGELAAALYARTGLTATVNDSTGAAVCWVGVPDAPPAPVILPLTLSGSADPSDAQTYNFVLSGAEAAVHLDYGDEESDDLAAGTTTASHTYDEQGTYQVVATSGEQRAELYAAVSGEGQTPLALYSLEPSSVEYGGADIDISLNGSGFQPGATALVDGEDMDTVFVSETLLTMTASPANVPIATDVIVYVRNADGGQTSSLPFSFTEPPEPPPEIPG